MKLARPAFAAVMAFSAASAALAQDAASLQSNDFQLTAYEQDNHVELHYADNVTWGRSLNVIRICNPNNDTQVLTVVDVSYDLETAQAAGMPDERRIAIRDELMEKVKFNVTQLMQNHHPLNVMFHDNARDIVLNRDLGIYTEGMADAWHTLIRVDLVRDPVYSPGCNAGVPTMQDYKAALAVYAPAAEYLRKTLKGTTEGAQTALKPIRYSR